MKKVLLTLVLTSLVITSISSQGASPSSLDPLIAIEKAKIRYSGWGLSDNGYVIPKKGFKLLVVFIRQLSPTEKISKSELDWTLRTDKGLIYKPIGFGFPTPKETIDMVGQLESGELFKFVGGNQPLLGLIFAVESAASELSLIDSLEKQFSVMLKKDFRPLMENVVNGFKCSGSLRGRIQGENWGIGR